MEIINLGKQNSIFNHFIREIRDVNIQKDSMRFRRNIERIGDNVIKQKYNRNKFINKKFSKKGKYQKRNNYQSKKRRNHFDAKKIANY